MKHFRKYFIGYMIYQNAKQNVKLIYFDIDFNEKFKRNQKQHYLNFKDPPPLQKKEGENQHTEKPNKKLTFSRKFIKRDTAFNKQFFFRSEIKNANGRQF